MNKSEFFSLSRNGRTGIDYSFLIIGDVVEVPLLGRTPQRAQRTLLQKAQRSNWVLVTRIDNGKLYALREK